jgi:hypothetical protein
LAVEKLYELDQEGNFDLIVEVMGRYSNPSDQGERLHDLLQLVPSRRGPCG